MKPRFQFSMGNTLLVTAFLSAWCAVTAYNMTPRGAPRPTPIICGCLLVQISMPAAAFGALFGRPLFGLACGLVAAGTYILWLLGVLYGLVHSY
jgi:hypothetical protein